ncbi:MAG: cell filamentation protein Fic, partial [Sphingobacteriaceae bacterium]
MKINTISQNINVFHERKAPEEGLLVGYGALINYYLLHVPIPDRLCIISKKHKRYETAEWLVFTPRHNPEDTLIGHLTFAFKYEGIFPDVLKALFSKIKHEDISEIIKNEPTSLYTRKLWFMYEWLLEKTLAIPDLQTGNFIDLIDKSLQYPGPVTPSKRHRVRNNLPGVRNFCPIVRRTDKLDRFIELHLNEVVKKTLGNIHKDVLARAAAFLLLKDSKASYAIEGERPPQNRAQRWGKAIGQAGQKMLQQDELLRLQQVVIDNPRFVKMGWRTEEGFVGEHDRTTGAPIPDHISARPKDLKVLIEGIIEANALLEKADYDSILAATAIAFGFVFIHPFVDGNGRIHRFLIHDVLIRKGFVSKGIIFPVSAVILEKIDEYRQVLEAYSHSRLALINWKPSETNNVTIQNETIDLYRYFDATMQAEFLYECVEQTVTTTIPEEVDYLEKYDRMKSYLDDYYEMPDQLVALLIRFLQQGNGTLSQRGKTKEFELLSE